MGSRIHISMAGLLACAIPLAAQAQTAPATRRDSALVLDHSFNAPIGEPVRVFLAKNMKYRVEIRGNGVQLQLRTVAGSMQQPLVEPFLAGESAADETMYTVTPHEDAEYEFITSGGEAGVPLDLHVYAINPPKKQP